MLLRFPDADRNPPEQQIQRPRDHRCLRLVEWAINPDDRYDKGVQMWDLLTKTDIAQAKQEMKLRRAEILRRHAEEGQKLDGDRLELETLYRLVDTFVEKYAKPTVVS